MEQIIEVSEYKIFTKIEGEGTPTLLLHSYWGSQLLFDQLTATLSKRFKVILIDLPGHGDSGNPPADYSFDSFAPVLNELLIRLNVTGKVSVVGHSMGGYIALAFAARYPERVASLTLMHSPVKEADQRSIKQRLREARLIANGRKDLLLQATIPSNFAPGNSDMMKEVVTLLNRTSNQVSVEGAKSSINAMNSRYNYLEMLKGARFPVLIVIGKHDKVYNADDQLNDARDIPGAEILYLHHSGHLGFLEESELVTGKIEAFLDNKIF